MKNCLLLATITLLLLALPKEPVLSSSAYEHLTLEEKICRVFGKDCQRAIKIARCESTMNPKAVNYADAKITGVPSWGLFQLNRKYDPRLLTADYNIAEAYKMFQRRSWQPWSCSKKV